VKSHFGYHYHLKKLALLGFEISTLRDLDESIDILCAHFGEADQDSSLKEEYCPYFGVLWEAGIGLSQFLQNQNLAGLRVLEIGCGLALPSFVATKAGAQIIATDFHADVPLFLAENQKQNKVHFEYQVMNWRDEVERTKNTFGLFDLVIGSDILYESQHALEVAKALIGLLKPGGKIILADPGRAYVQKFVTCMQELNYPEKMSIQTVKAEWTQQNKEKEVFIFEFQLKA
jgi:predicted nicotinamide N-methyase